MTTTLDRPADFSAARRAMIDGQLRTSGVNERFVLERMGAVAREDFVPDQARGTAYMDRAIRLPDGGFLPAPVFHGTMLEEARPRLTDNVLIVDGGSGYLAELIRPLVASVESISATQGAQGKAELEAADLLLIDGAIEHLPPELASRIVEDGRIVTGLIDRGVSRLATGRKIGQSLSLLPLAEMGIPRLGQFDRPASWSF
ncbi:protein-L-isoaspartate O-methyltransferase [Erythrobacter sp. QSSC1-22B]|uniref:protein-L-isoaspartate O-methyltransferase family protein n=1 Tax=Erythrobacter sp. QSSC1-22B TaxID=1860125 RepID=UPI000805E61D|nr:protein-L-isoaspartate O-methyltransferase [Erythrobacter sp. QSSC1-22B]OBX20018.1 protein-L-isoaspartate O-methyltransferase [Erythrobacter sp. QSSC1-22B]